MSIPESPSSVWPNIACSVAPDHNFLHTTPSIPPPHGEDALRWMQEPREARAYVPFSRVQDDPLVVGRGNGNTGRFRRLAPELATAHLVAAFDLDAVTDHPADFAIVRDGGLAMYRRASVLREAEGTLRELGYETLRLDSAGWDEDGLHDTFAAALRFPSYYGRNLNALWDCLYDVAHGDYGWNPGRTGLAVTIDGFGVFARQDSELATATAEALVRATRSALLFGHRLLWLLQVDDGQFRLRSIGRAMERP